MSDGFKMFVYKMIEETFNKGWCGNKEKIQRVNDILEFVRSYDEMPEWFRKHLEESRKDSQGGFNHTKLEGVVEELDNLMERLENCPNIEENFVLWKLRFIKKELQKLNDPDS